MRQLLKELREKRIIRILPSGTLQLREFRLEKSGNGKPVKIYCLAPTSAIMIDTIGFTDQVISTNQTSRIFAVRKVIIKDVEKQNKPLLTKVISPNEINLTKDLKISYLKYYPNPSNGKFTLSFKVPRAGDMAIKIYDQLGREVHLEDYQFFSGNYQKEISMAHADRGVYFLKIIQGDSALIKKLVIE